MLSETRLEGRVVPVHWIRQDFDAFRRGRENSHRDAEPAIAEVSAREFTKSLYERLTVSSPNRMIIFPGHLGPPVM